MRPVLILCEPRHLADVLVHIQAHAHPQLIGAMVTAYAVNPDLVMQEAQNQVISWVLEARKANEGCQVVATREIARFLELPALKVPLKFDLRITSAASLTARENRGNPLVKSLITGSGLDVVSAASSMAQQWSHASLNRAHVEHWLQQFVRLDRNGWIGKALLGQVRLTSSAALSETLFNMTVDPDAAICVSREPRGGFKSADVLGNMLHKRFIGRKVHPSPAAAIEIGGQRRVVLFEDGLWSGTEAMGIIDSLLGRRDSKLKTARLQVPELLRETSFRLAYAVGTDYGQALLRRYLDDNELPNVEIHCSDVLQIAQPELLAQMRDPSFALSSIRDAGPESALLRPHVFEALKGQGMSHGDVARAVAFSKTVGAQLFSNYVDAMKVTAGWSAWAPEKIERASVGMHGLGLTHGFSHSIPKASLPLFWGSGKVQLNGSEVNWSPLFPNS
ncbi:MAG TPA: hypothetical protein VGO04_09425 [Ensifer sp.]|jgi:hypothetical protein|uniref:phosphoribosyltransferase-like protein n=1 Tax=Ensifer sp. TaxID=1872086 RepID=UPI002E11D582|nr:hypothetical protein [Ensifer sp.]